MSTYSALPVPTLRDTVIVGPRLRRQGRDVHIVHDPKARRYFQVTPKEEFILSRFNGGRTFGEVEDEFARSHGTSLTEQSWKQFFSQLNSPTMFAHPDTTSPEVIGSAPVPRPDAARRTKNTLLNYRVPLLDPSSMIERTLRRLPNVVSSRSLLLTLTAVLVMLGGAASSITSHWSVYLDLMATAPWTVVAAYIIVFPTLALHEFAHGLTCVAVGGKSPEMGVAWRFPLFTVYTRTEDIYLIMRARDRVLVAAAGVMAGLLGMFPVFVGQLVFPPGTLVGNILLVSLIVGILLHLVNLIPFVGLDGQKILSHALGVWDIAQESRHYFASLARRRSYPPLRTGFTFAIPLYGIVAACVLTLFSVWGIWSLVMFLNTFLGGWRTLGALVVVACVSLVFILTARRSS